MRPESACLQAWGGRAAPSKTTKLEKAAVRDKLDHGGDQQAVKRSLPICCGRFGARGAPVKQQPYPGAWAARTKLLDLESSDPPQVRVSPSLWGTQRG